MTKSGTGRNRHTPIHLATIGFLLALGNSIVPAWGEEFYVRPHVCKNEQENLEKVPTDPLRYLSKIGHNQGESNSCGYHAGTVLLESFVNSQTIYGTDLEPVSLSVLDAMRKLGICSIDQIKESSINPISFLLSLHKMKELEFLPHFATVHELLSCQATSDSQIEAIFTAIKQAAVPISIPSFQIVPRDFQGNEDPNLIAEELLSHFKNPQATTVALNSCFGSSDPVTCTDVHAINLIGIEKQICDGTTHYTGIFKNSWGASINTYDLTKILSGIIKYRLGYVTLKPCDGKCQDSPLSFTRNSNPIFHFAEVNDADSISAFVQKHPKASIDQKGPNGATPLYHAAENGYTEIVKRLLLLKASPNEPLINGTTPLHAGAAHGHTEIVKMLLKKKANPNLLTGGNSPLHLAAGKHKEVVRLLLSHKANPNTPTGDGVAPLMISAYNKKWDIVLLLLEAKDIDPYPKSAKGISFGTLLIGAPLDVKRAWEQAKARRTSR